MCLRGKKKSRQKRVMRKTSGKQEKPDEGIKNANSKPKLEYNESYLMVALWNYTPGGSDELRLKKGNELVRTNHEEDNDQWVHVMTVDDGRKGFVPAEWIAKKSEDKCREWYYTHGLYNKRDIKILLEDKQLGKGAFAIFEIQEKQLILKVRLADLCGSQKNLKSFRIRREGNEVTIQESVFPSLNELVETYKKEPIFEDILLTKCPVRPPPRRKELARAMLGQLRADRTQLEIGEKLGSGNYGMVYKGVYMKTIEVAVKQMKVKAIQAVEAFYAEAKIMRALNHRNLVTCYGICDDDPICILTEFMVNGPLDKYLRKRKADDDLCIEKELFDILAQVAKGMEYLVSNDLVHRDLAARNVLVGERNSRRTTVKISDFGLARIVDAGAEAYRATTAVQIALRWTAPESYNYGIYLSASDVWSFGVLMHEVLTHGKKPYPGMMGKEVQQKIKTGWRMPQDELISDEMYNIMKQCWMEDTKQRPSFKKLNEVFEEIRADDTTTIWTEVHTRTKTTHGQRHTKEATSHTKNDSAF